MVLLHSGARQRRDLVFVVEASARDGAGVGACAVVEGFRWRTKAGEALGVGIGLWVVSEGLRAEKRRPALRGGVRVWMWMRVGLGIVV